MSYFKPLRRKLGIVRLAMALYLLGFWGLEQVITYAPGHEPKGEIWLLITPLTLLSAYLLLSKSRAGQTPEKQGSDF